MVSNAIILQLKEHLKNIWDHFAKYLMTSFCVPGIWKIEN